MKNAVKASKKNTHAKSAVIYARVSTINQKENETVAGQLKRLRQYCKDYGYRICFEYVDEAIGGSDKQRAYDLIDYLQSHAKAIDYVIFTVFDRFSRNYSLCGYLEFSCLRLDIELLAIEQEDLFGAEPDPMRDLQRNIIKSFAQYERDIITMRLRKGRLDKAVDRGIKSQGNCPLGYHYEGDTTKDKHVVIHAKEAEVVKLIFKTFLETGSTTRTARLINEAGYTTKRGGKFYPQTVQTILQNDFYTGMITYNGTRKRGKHKPLVSKHLFTKAQKKFTGANGVRGKG